ncbi:MAG: biotin--[acetyl-CoA-carboxylase] ligase [Candidatus Margulisbacteria bacterium]|nr:biotin--[acetyl-CoA-carboxylase] ligase [Candidatus Margulisiibacteriota bacterium]
MIIGRKIIHYKEIGSTSDEARRLVGQGEGEGLVVVADKQARGRGKPGSGWFSPAGNLYLSVIVKPYKNPAELAPITLLAALAARAALIRLSKLPVVIKWPNDLRIRGKKVGGILTERLPSGFVIIGLGLNINMDKRAWPKEIKGSATSLKLEAKKKFSLKKCLGTLLEELDREYLAYLAKVW